MSTIDDDRDLQDSNPSTVSGTTSPKSPVKDVWNSIRTRFQERPSLWPLSLFSDSILSKQTNTADDEDSRFCDSLWDAMLRSKRFDYLGLAKAEKKGSENIGVKEHNRRFSSSR